MSFTQFVFKTSGAANFCMQKFLTGLAGLVYLWRKLVYCVDPALAGELLHLC